MTKKDAYYFSHDANAQDDPKCMLLIDQLGMEGYGIFWALVEKLRAERDYKLPMIIIGSLAKRWGTSKEKVDAVIRSYGLFVVDDESRFFSERLLRSMTEKTEKARKSISYRWGNTDVIQTNTNVIRNDTIKGKESKVNESKVNESKGKSIADKPQRPQFSQPDVHQLTNYFCELNLDDFTAQAQAAKFLDYYNANGWKIGGRAAMKDWQAAARNWKKNINNFSNGTHQQSLNGAVKRGKSAGASDFLAESKEFVNSVRSGDY